MFGKRSVGQPDPQCRNSTASLFLFKTTSHCSAATPTQAVTSTHGSSASSAQFNTTSYSSAVASAQSVTVTTDPRSLPLPGMVLPPHQLSFKTVTHPSLDGMLASVVIFAEGRVHASLSNEHGAGSGPQLAARAACTQGEIASFDPPPCSADYLIPPAFCTRYRD